MILCACGCGRELPKRRAMVSKYIRGHYSKMCKDNPTEKIRLRAEIKKIKSNTKFMVLYKRLKQIERFLEKNKRKVVRNTEEKLVIDYSKASKYCSHYDNNDIKCVMCFENHIEKPQICPKGE